MSYGSELFPRLPVAPPSFAAAPIEDAPATASGDWLPPAAVDPTAAHVASIISSADLEACFDGIVGELAKETADDASGVLPNSDLLRECESLRDRVLARITEQRSKRQAGLAAERDGAYATCRHLLDSIEELAREYGRLNNLALNFATSTLNPTAAKVNAIGGNAPRRSDYPSKQEVERWRAELRAAESELASKQAQHRELRSAADAVLEQWQQRKAELKTAQEQEQILTARLEGRAYRDPRLGLYHAPEL